MLRLPCGLCCSAILDIQMYHPFNVLWPVFLITLNLIYCVLHMPVVAMEGETFNRLALREALNNFRGHQITHVTLKQKCRITVYLLTYMFIV
jgi:hypothetical protein